MSRSEKGHGLDDAASSGFTVMFNTTLSSGPGPLLSSHILSPPSFPLIFTDGSFYQKPEVGLSEFPETTSSEGFEPGGTSVTPTFPSTTAAPRVTFDKELHITLFIAT